MLNERPLSDRAITIICYYIGVISLFLNCLCLFLIWKLRNTCSRSIFVVLILLQILYTIQNIHFAILFIPFINIKLGGGYCIGFSCVPHYATFSTNLLIFLFLTGSLGGLFVVLLFLRHQSLLRETSRIKLGDRGKIVFAFLLMVGNWAYPIRFSVMDFTASESARNKTMEEHCKPCDWIEKQRNFGVIPMEGAGSIDGILVSLVSTLVTAFAVACTIHIVHIIHAHNKLRSSFTLKRTIRQTRQSLIQMATFAAFLTVPIVLFISLLVFEFDDDSIVLIPSIFLLSLNSMAHSTLIIVHSPTFRDTFLRRFYSEQISAASSQFSVQPRQAA